MLEFDLVNAWLSPIAKMVKLLSYYYYLRQKKRIAFEESWFIVARSVQIHSLNVSDVPSK